MFVSCLADSHLRLSWWFGLTVQGFEPLVFAEGEWEITQANRGKLKLIAQRHVFFCQQTCLQGGAALRDYDAGAEDSSGSGTASANIARVS